MLVVTVTGLGGLAQGSCSVSATCGTGWKRSAPPHAPAAHSADACRRGAPGMRGRPWPPNAMTSRSPHTAHPTGPGRGPRRGAGRHRVAYSQAVRIGHCGQGRLVQTGGESVLRPSPRPGPVGSLPQPHVHAGDQVGDPGQIQRERERRRDPTAVAPPSWPRRSTGHPSSRRSEQRAPAATWPVTTSVGDRRSGSVGRSRDVPLLIDGSDASPSPS